MFRIPFYRPELTEADIEAVKRALQSGCLSSGPATRQFEEQFARFLGADYAVAVCSGTAALHLALEAAGVTTDDEVITTPYTFVATSHAIRHCGAHPVFVDCDRETLNICPELIEERITARTKAILPVHIAGQSCEVERISAVAKKYRLAVIHDAAHSFPARYGDALIGTFPDLTCFSFYATKPLCTGEGGMVVTDNEAWARRCRSLSIHGLEPVPWDLTTVVLPHHRTVCAVGYKYNLSDIQAALGIAQLARAAETLEKRRRIAACYNTLLAECDLLETPQVSDFAAHSWHLYIVKLRLEDLALSRDELMVILRAKGIETSVHFRPTHLYPYYAEKYRLAADDLPNAHWLFQRVISLPLYPAMTRDEAGYVAETLSNVLAEHRRR